MNKLNAAIGDIPIPKRMQKLPISDKGFPIPAFVAWLAPDKNNYLPVGARGAVRDFRVIDSRYMDACFRMSKCWLCAEPLGRYRVFAIGPMCLVNRTTMEPPSHRDCAEYAVAACPFLSRPKMVRNEKDLPEHHRMTGTGILRNPGVTALYQTNDYRRFRVGDGMLCRLGTPERIDWYAEGKRATRAQVKEAIDSGMPILMQDAASEGPEAVAELRKLRAEATPWFPE